jgi:two-component system response regulator YesN
MKLKVLIVEDEELIRNEITLTTPWEDFSCRVVGTAENGLDGEQLIRELLPDIVITDIRMPGQNGIEMLKKAMPPAAIILSGHSDFDYAKQAIQLGVKDYLLKPVDDTEFYKSLKKVVEKLLSVRTEEIQRADSRLNIQDIIEYKPAGNKQDYYIEKAREFIRSNYAEDISLRDASQYIGITESYLSRLFKSKMNFSFLEYLKDYRIKKALELMKDQGRRINEVARDTGFRDMSYFSSVFKKHTGMSPSQYQNGSKEK